LTWSLHSSSGFLKVKWMWGDLAFWVPQYRDVNFPFLQKSQPRFFFHFDKHFIILAASNCFTNAGEGWRRICVTENRSGCIIRSGILFNMDSIASYQMHKMMSTLFIKEKEKYFSSYLSKIRRIPVIPSWGTFPYPFYHFLMCNFKLPSWKEKGGHDSSFRVGMNHCTCSWRRKNKVTWSGKLHLRKKKNAYTHT
jgi:hypothetical protein